MSKVRHAAAATVVIGSNDDDDDGVAEYLEKLYPSWHGRPRCAGMPLPGRADSRLSRAAAQVPDRGAITGTTRTSSMRSIWPT